MKTWTKRSFFASVTCAVGGAYWLYEKRRISLDNVGGAARPSEYELKLVQVLFRHGARTPLKSLPGTLQVRDLYTKKSVILTLLCTFEQFGLDRKCSWF
uniref:Acid phosphatase n=1 Tax=Erpetoichthys calabaricus TaxID=27687 RepID=A0A8C4S2X0_ERPCA